jgi:hypothetical protein
MLKDQLRFMQSTNLSSPPLDICFELRVPCRVLIQVEENAWTPAVLPPARGFACLERPSDVPFRSLRVLHAATAGPTGMNTTLDDHLDNHRNLYIDLSAF